MPINDKYGLLIFNFTLFSLFWKNSRVLLQSTWLLQIGNITSETSSMVTSYNQPIPPCHNDQLLWWLGSVSLVLCWHLLVGLGSQMPLKVAESSFGILVRFRKMQDRKELGLNSSAKYLRKRYRCSEIFFLFNIVNKSSLWWRRNLVSMRFNMMNWLLETISLVLVMIGEYKLSIILYLLVTSCGTPLVYYLGIEENRRLAREHFNSRIRIFKKNKVAAWGFNI